MKTKSAILLIAYDRPDHFSKVLNALREESVSSFYCFVDHPVTSNEKLNIRNKDVIRLAEAVNWANVKLIIRKENMGLARNLTDAVSTVLNNHDSVIVLEDDCVPRRGFISYMNYMIEAYGTDRRVRSICGYLLPVLHHKIFQSHIFLTRFCPWGWATWADRWKDFILPLGNALAALPSFAAKIESVGEDVKDYCSDEYFLDPKAEIWSLSWIITHLRDASLCIYPSCSLINNIGFDGSGVHSSVTSAFDLATLSESDDLRNSNWQHLSPYCDVVLNQDALDYMNKFSTHSMRLRMRNK